MKKILLLHMLVFVSATLPISSVASDEVETLKCTIIADAITGNTLYETGECARRVSPCSSFKLPLAIMGFDSGILQSPKSPTWELKPEYNPSREIAHTNKSIRRYGKATLLSSSRSN